jgi:hypothetical protein
MWSASACCATRRSGARACSAPSAVRFGQQRHGQAKRLGLALAADQLHARDDVAPLVRAAHLHGDPMRLVEVQEIVCLPEPAQVVDHQRDVGTVEREQRFHQSADAPHVEGDLVLGLHRALALLARWVPHHARTASEHHDGR